MNKLCGLVIVIVLTFSFPAAGAQNLSSVEGIVIKRGTSEPLPNVRVILTVPPVPTSLFSPYTTTTDGAGKFTIGKVPSGRYNLSVISPGYYRPPRSGPAVLTLSPDAPLRDVRVFLQPTGSIDGRVLDENGEPAATTLELMQVRFVDGIKLIGRAQSGAVFTDDRGGFHIPDLPPGEYFLRATPRSVDTTFSAVYYPGVANPELAIALKLGPGTDLQGIDFSLLHGDVRRISLKLVYPPSVSGFRPLFFPRPRASKYQVSGRATLFENLTDGTFVSPPLPPGQYVLDIDARPPTGTRWPMYQATVDFEIRDKDVDLGSVPVVIGPDIGGKVIYKGVPAAAPNALMVRLRGLDLRTADTVPPPAPVDGTGAFAISHIPLQRLLTVEVSGLRANEFVESIRYAAQPADITGLRFSRDEGPLEITVSAPSGAVRGMVHNNKDEPLAEIRVVLIPPANRRGPAVRFLSTVSDETGNFLIPNVPPGEWRILALEDAIPTGYSAYYEDPEFLTVFETKGLAISVGRGQTTNVTLQSLVVPE